MKMNISILILIISSLSCFSQKKEELKKPLIFDQHVGFGIGINTNDNYRHSEGNLLFANIDLLQKNRMVYGIEFGLGKSISDEQNYTGTVSKFRYSEDIDGIVYSQTMFAGRIGYRLNPDLYIVSSIGASFFNQFQERFDDFYILGNDGLYFVSTGVSETEIYLKGSIVYKLGMIALELGYANSGAGLGLIFNFL